MLSSRSGRIDFSAKYGSAGEGTYSPGKKVPIAAWSCLRTRPGPVGESQVSSYIAPISPSVSVVPALQMPSSRHCIAW